MQRNTLIRKEKKNLQSPWEKLTSYPFKERKETPEPYQTASADCTWNKSASAHRHKLTYSQKKRIKAVSTEREEILETTASGTVHTAIALLCRNMEPTSSRMSDIETFLKWLVNLESVDVPRKNGNTVSRRAPGVISTFFSQSHFHRIEGIWYINANDEVTYYWKAACQNRF